MIDDDKRRLVYARAGRLCEVCHVARPLHGPWGIRGEVAHRVANTKWCRERYGEDMLDHVDNLAWTCPGRCNDAVLITFKPVARERLMTDIATKLAQGEG